MPNSKGGMARCNGIRPIPANNVEASANTGTVRNAMRIGVP